MNDRYNTLNHVRAEAYRLLASRGRTEREVRNRLQQRGYGVSDIDSVVRQLVVDGYLDDRKVISDWARYRLQGKPLGRRRLQWEIQRRGIDSELLEEVLNDVYADFDQLTLAEQALRKRLRVQGVPQSISERQKLSRHLMSLGFESEIANAALSTILESMVAHNRADEEEPV